MKNLLNYFILDKYRENKLQGYFHGASLFADISGFTRFTEALSKKGKGGAEALSEIINRFFSLCINTVYERKGFISHFEGDAFLAYFNDPLSGVIAAYEISSVFNNTEDYIEDFPISIKIGLSYGKINWFIIGDNEKKTYFFRGYAVDRSSELESMAYDEILLDEEIYMKAKNYIITEEKHSKIYQLQGLRTILPKSNAKISEPDINILKIFFPDNIIENPPIPEIRNIISIFISFKHMENACLEKFVLDIISFTKKWGGYFNRISFADKGGIVLLNFGIPHSHENNMQRALNCIIDISLVYGEEIRAGITFGRLFSGFLGNNIIASYDVLGEAVNLSAGIAMKANWGSICLTEEIAGQMENDYIIEYYNQGRIKGKSGLCSIYHLIGPKEYLDQENNKKLHGREKELKKLMDFISPVYENRYAGILYLLGEAGIGKTLLINKAFRNNSGIRLINLKCDSILKKPLNPFISYFENLFNQNILHEEEQKNIFFENIYEDLCKDLKRKKIKNKMKAGKIFIKNLLSLDIREKHFKELSPQEKYENTIYAIKDLFTGLSSIKPIIIHIEGIQWIDSESEIMLETLIRNIDDFPIALICSGRHNDDGSKPCPIPDSEDIKKEIILKGISMPSAKELMKEKLGNYPDEDLLKIIYEKTHFNPFFIEQFCMYMIEKKLIFHKNNVCSLINTNIDIPIIINQILLARIDRLSLDIKELTRIASVIGIQWNKSVLFESVSNLLKIPDNKDLIDGKTINSILCKDEIILLNEGEKENIWNRSDLETYYFRSSLIRDILYDIQLRERIKVLHKVIAYTMESFSKRRMDKVDGPYLDLAYHFEKAGMIEKTKEYLKKAANLMEKSYINQEAIRLYKKLIDYAEDIKEKIEIKLKIFNLYLLIGRLKEAEKIMEECLDLPDNPEYKMLRSEIFNSFGTLRRHQGKLKEALESYHKSRDMYLDLSDRDHYGFITGNMGLVYFIQGKYDKAMECFIISQDIAAEGKDMIQFGAITGNIGMIHFNQGKYDQALDSYSIQKEICRSLNNKKRLVNIESNIGLIYLNRGDLKKAKDSFIISKNLAEEIGYKKGIAVAMGNIGLIYHSMNEYSQSLDFFQESQDIAIEIGDKTLIIISLLHIGLIYYHQKKIKEALECFRKTRDLSSETGDREALAASISNMGAVYFDLGQYDMAIKYAMDSKEIYSQIGNQLNIGNSCSLLGDIYYKLGIYEKSIHYYLQYYQISVKIDIKKDIAKAAELLSKIYEKIGDHKNKKKYEDIILEIDKT